MFLEVGNNYLWWFEWIICREVDAKKVHPARIRTVVRTHDGRLKGREERRKRLVRVLICCPSGIVAAIENYSR